MKLRTKIAGTLALPLALAVAANVNAAQITDELQVSGFIAATADWTLYDDAAGQDSDVDFGLGLGTSRIGVTYVKNGVTYQYENDWNGNGKDGRGTGDEYRLRHAVIKYDGWEAGYTWSGFANLTALAETIDAAGPTSFSANANRTAKLGKAFEVANGMKVGIYLEDYSHGLNSDSTSKGSRNTFAGTDTNGEDITKKANTAIPDVVVNFNGDFGDTKVFAAARLLSIGGEFKNGKVETETAVDFALGLSQNLINDDLNIKLAVLSLDKAGDSYLPRSEDGRDLGLQLGLQYKINDQIRTNLVVEQVIRDEDDADTTGIWLNGFYALNNGWEWGAELRYATVEDNAAAAKIDVSGLGEKDMRVSLLAKYAF